MRPRANTLGIIVKDGHVLLEENRARHSKGYGFYYRPIGGTIELGERSREALVREFMEEINTDVRIVKSLGCIENIYKLNGRIGHEITLMYQVEFVDPLNYEKDSFVMTEGKKITAAKWVRIEHLADKVVFPNGLLELLQEEFSCDMETT